MIAKRILAAGLLAIAWLGCSNSIEPETALDGRITLVFEKQQNLSATQRQSSAPPLDSAVVRVFRPTGNSPEVSKGAGLAGAPSAVKLDIQCIAENGKRVSVELYAAGVMVYHGVETGVNVSRDATTAVNVDAYDFVVSSLTVSPPTASEGELVTLRWDGAPAAQQYILQESATSNFASVAWESTITDTSLAVQRNPGAHHFRVAPRTNYAVGTYAPAKLSYVLGSGNVPVVSSVETPEVIPGDVGSITGQNLDYPGTKVYIGAVECQITSSAWGRITFVVAAQARTDFVWVNSGLGWAGSTKLLTVQRIAFVSRTGLYSSHYKEYLEYFPDDVEYSSVAIVPVADLDWRDMSAFDVIVVSPDAGTSALDWGGNPARAIVIANSGARILAIGVGGATYLAMTSTLGATLTFSSSTQQAFYVANGNEDIFTKPHWVTNPGPVTVQFCTIPTAMITMDIAAASKPASMSLYASVAAGVERWPLVEYSVLQNGRPVRHVFFGYSGDPYSLTGQGSDCLSNMLYLLYTDAGALPPAASAR